VILVEDDDYNSRRELLRQLPNNAYFVEKGSGVMVVGISWILDSIAASHVAPVEPFAKGYVRW
jgi:hypothetical protein